MKKILLILLLLLCVFIFGCKEKIDPCETFARTIIPENVTLYEIDADTYCWVSQGDYNQLRNGEVFEEGICARRGTSVGQNVNYFYTTARNILPYSTQVISQSGLIKGEDRFTIKVNILEPLEGTNRTIPEIEEPVKDFRILHYEFLSCSHIK